MDGGVVPIFLILMGLTSFAAVLIASYTWVSQEKTRTNTLFLGVMLSVGLWAVGAMGNVVAAGYAQDIHWAFRFHALSYLGMLFFAPCLLMFVVSFVGEEWFFTSWRAPVVCLIPSFAMFLGLITTRWHQWFYVNIYLEQWAGYPVLRWTRGPLAIVTSMVMYILEGIAGFTLLRFYVLEQRDPPEKRGCQIGLILLGFGIAIGTGMLYEFFRPPLEVRVVGLLAGLLLVRQMLFQSKFIKILPLARDYVIANLKEGFLVLNHRMELMDFNQQARDYLFAGEENLLGANLLALCPNQMPQRVRDGQMATLRQGIQEILAGRVRTKEVEVRIQPGEGGERVIGINLSAMWIKERGYVIGLLRDITEHTQMAGLKESEQRFRSLVEQSLDGIALLAQDGTIQFCNRAFATLYGRNTIKQIEGRSILEFTPPEQHETERGWLETAFQEGDGPKIRFTLGQRADAGSFNLEQRFHVVRDPTTEMRLLQVVGRDVSARMDLERRRADFIAMASHELRTPLTIIRGYVELLDRRVGELDRATQTKHYATIQRNVARLERLINDVSTLQQLEQGVFELKLGPLDFAQFLTEALQPYQTLLSGQLKYQRISSKKRVMIEGDPDRLLQVIDKLLDNAIKHTSSEQRRIRVVPEVLPNWVYVHIIDNGAGIAAVDLERIFEQFTTIPTQYYSGGSGIGLYLARMIIEMHNGTLKARSSGKGRGATFFLKLPRKPGRDAGVGGGEVKSSRRNAP